MTDTTPVMAFKAPTPSETAVLLLRARQMRAEAMATMLASVASFAAARARGIFSRRRTGIAAPQA